MKIVAEGLVGLVFFFIWIFIWIGGVVIAKGTVSTLAAIFTGGFWSIYLIIEFILKYHGLL